MESQSQFVSCPHQERMFLDNQVFFVDSVKSGRADTVIFFNHYEIKQLFKLAQLQFMFMRDFSNDISLKLLRYATGSSVVTGEELEKRFRFALPQPIQDITQTTAALIIYDTERQGFNVESFTDISTEETILQRLDDIALKYCKTESGQLPPHEALSSIPAKRKAQESSNTGPAKYSITRSKTPLSDISYSISEDEPYSPSGRFRKKDQPPVRHDYGSGSVRYSIDESNKPYDEFHPSKKELVNEVEADFETQKLINSIQREWKLLAAKGITEELLLSILRGAQTLTPLLVTDGHLYLPSLDNTLIKMAPLDRAFYVLFLHHPEGINYKDMVDHKEELYLLYHGFSARINRKLQLATVERFVDPTRNDMSVSASRIKRAFLAVLTPELAQHYYIRGEQGDVKKITLNRELVKFKYNKLSAPGEKRSFFDKLAEWFGM